MNLKVSKRDGSTADFVVTKIINAIASAVVDARNPSFDSDEFYYNYIKPKLLEYANLSSVISIEEINDIIEACLIEQHELIIWEQFHFYREDRLKTRLLRTALFQFVKRIGVCTDRDNANVGNNFASKFLRIASETNKQFNLANMPKSIAKHHEILDIYYHDCDSYNLTINCLHIDTGFHFRKGFNTGYGTLTKPHRIETAAELSCVMLQSSQNDCFGGQSHVDYDNDLGAFIEPTRQEIINEYAEVFKCTLEEHQIGQLAEDITPQELYDMFPKYRKLIEDHLVTRVHHAMQSVVCKYNTMHSRAGSQVPFSSLNIGLPRNEDAALVCQILLEEFNNGINGAPPIFPNIIFRVKSGLNRDPGDTYYYLFELACKVAANRMNPTFMNMDADFNLKYYNKGIYPATMGCRTYICSNVNGPEGPNRRGNNAPCTINLPRIGLEAREDFKKFYQILDERLDWASEALLHRFSVLSQLKGKDLPFVVGEKFFLGSEEVGPEDSIRPILEQGSWAIGFIGLAETTKALIGTHMGESKEAHQLALEIVAHMRDYCDKLIEKTHLNWGCYGTPAEGLSGKFVVADRKRYGVVEGVTDKDYYTNSFHIPVGYPISIIEKIQLEAPFHAMCNSGHITYLEFDGAPDAETILKVITYAYTHTNISYMGINFHLRYCKDCGYTVNEISHTCPNCSSRNIQGISRVTGYLSLDERFGAGKIAERKDRVAHGGKTVGTHVYKGLR